MKIHRCDAYKVSFGTDMKDCECAEPDVRRPASSTSYIHIWTCLLRVGSKRVHPRKPCAPIGIHLGCSAMSRSSNVPCANLLQTWPRSGDGSYHGVHCKRMMRGSEGISLRRKPTVTKRTLLLTYSPSKPVSKRC